MRALLEVAAWWAALLLVWLATLTAFSLEELATASALAVPCALAARAARRAAGIRWRIKPGWARWLLSVPWSVLHDTVAVLLLAVRPDRPEDDSFQEVVLSGDRDSAGRNGHEALATAALSAAPGSVVVDAGEQHDRLLVHTLPIGRTRLERAVRR
jgi:multisubunit Na+/H+ antiporter MnhE subunit